MATAGEKVARYILELGGDDDALQTVFAGMKTRIKDAVSEIERITSKVDLFGDIGDKVKVASDALTRAKQDVTTFTAALAAAKGAGKDVTTELEKRLSEAEKATKSATGEFNRQVDAVSKLQSQLTKAGVDTSNLAAAELKLAQAHKDAADAAALQAAKQQLGVTTLKDIQPEIQKLITAYNTLANSGKLSTTELATAQQVLRDKIAEVRAGVTGAGSDALVNGPKLASFFTGSVLPALGLVGVAATVVTTLKEAVVAAHEFETGVVRIGTVTNLSKSELDTLADSVKTLARDIGFDLNDGLKGLYELLRSGVPPENAIEVLRISAIAAKAAAEDLSVGVKAANALISSFRLPVSELGAALDAVAVAAKNGGPTLKEFGDNAGPLLVVAKAANVPLNELVATLGVLTNATGDAGLATSTLTQIIKKVDTDEARGKLHELGIETGSLSGIFKQLGERKLPIDEVLNLGLAGSKAAVGLLALTQNADQLGPAMDATAQAIGANQKAADAYADTGKGRSEKLKAEFSVALENIGAAVGTGSKLGQVATDLLGAFNYLSSGVGYLAKGGDAAGISFGGMVDAMNGVTVASTQLTPAVQSTQVRIDALAIKIAEARKELSEFAKSVLDDAKKLQEAATQEVAAIKQAADNEIAALDKSAAAYAETAARTLEIQTRSAQDRLAVLEKNEIEVKELTDKAVAQREAALRESQQQTKTSEIKLQAELAQIRLDSLAKQIPAYQSFYDEQTRLAQQAASKVAQIEQSRIAFNEGIEKQLFDIRVAGLSSFDQYVAKSKEADRLVSEARRAAAEGDSKAAENFAKQAIEIAKTLGVAYSVNGAQIVSAGQAQEAKLKVIKEASELVNTSYKEQGDAARTGQVLAEVYQGRALAKLIQMNLEADELKATAAEGLNYKTTLDQKAYDDTLEKINELTKERELLIRVKTVDAAGDDVPVGKTLAETGFNRGGYVQKFARGGHAWSVPNWTKVPGVGNSDSVPALLKHGSFVVRKSSSQMYGDGVMNLLARGYADGGRIDPYGILSGGTGSLLNKVGNLSPSSQVDVSDPDWVNNWERPMPAGVTKAEKARLIAVEAEGFFTKLLSYGQGLPTSPYGDLGDYIRRGLLQIKDRAARNDPDGASKILAYFKTQADTFVYAFRYAQQFHQPAVQPINAVGLADVEKYKFGQFEAAVDARLAERKAKYGYARGGSVDSVHALLTPGEHVLNPMAVQRVERMFGGGFLPALNAGMIPRGALQNMVMAPPQRFAMGGPVNYTPASGKGAASWSGGSPLVGELHLHGAPADFASESNFRRFIAPAFRDMERRMGKKK